MSVDPAMGEYVPEAGADTSKLPNGGVYNTTNLQVFNYGNNNPVKYNDPTGEVPFCVITAMVGGGIGAAYRAYKSYKETGSVDWKEVWRDAAIGAGLGLGLGMGASYLATGSVASNFFSIYVGAHLKLAQAGAAGYASFEKFKQVFGRAGDGKAWHHIVEQNAGNIGKFGAKAVHNSHNIVKISNGAGSLHSKITGYYNSVQKFTGDLTVREWLSTQSYEKQWKFGLKKLTEFATELGVQIEFVE